MPPKNDPEQRARQAQDYADVIPNDAELNDDYEATYRDGSLKNECWDDRAWSNNASESNDWRND